MVSPDRLIFPRIIREKGTTHSVDGAEVLAWSVKMIRNCDNEVRVALPKMKFGSLLVVSFVIFSWIQACAQAHDASGNKKASADYSGMYSFLREGEFVQVTVEEVRVTGFVSRYGDTESDRGEFLDHFFKQGKLEGNQLTFTTQVVHGLAYEFRGRVERGEGKNPGDEAYYVLKGTLTENTVDGQKKTSSRSMDVALKGFPQDLAPAHQK